MSGTQLTLKRALGIYLSSWRTLLAAGSLTLVPIAAAVLGERLKPATPWASLDTLSASTIVASVVQLVVHLVTSAVLISIVVNRIEGGSLSAWEAWRCTLGRTRLVLSASAASMVVMAGWMFLVGVPFAIISVVTWEFSSGGMGPGASVFICGASLANCFIALVMPIAIIEGKPGFSATRRNAQLRKGNMGRIVRLLWPVYIVWFGGSVLLALAVGEGALGDVVAGVFVWLVMPFEAACALLLYSDLEKHTPSPKGCEAARGTAKRSLG